MFKIILLKLEYANFKQPSGDTNTPSHTHKSKHTCTARCIHTTWRTTGTEKRAGRSRRAEAKMKRVDSPIGMTIPRTATVMLLPMREWSLAAKMKRKRKKKYGATTSVSCFSNEFYASWWKQLIYITSRQRLTSCYVYKWWPISNAAKSTFPGSDALKCTNRQKQFLVLKSDGYSAWPLGRS